MLICIVILILKVYTICVCAYQEHRKLSWEEKKCVGMEEITQIISNVWINYYIIL